jgi:hypothetical protein
MAVVMISGCKIIVTLNNDPEDAVYKYSKEHKVTCKYIPNGYKDLSGGEIVNGVIQPQSYTEEYECSDGKKFSYRKTTL